MGLREEYLRGKVPFSMHPIKSICHFQCIGSRAIGLVNDDVGLVHLAEVVFVRLLIVEFLFFPPVN